MQNCVDTLKYTQKFQDNSNSIQDAGSQMSTLNESIIQLIELNVCILILIYLFTLTFKHGALIFAQAMCVFSSPLLFWWIIYFLNTTELIGSLKLHALPSLRFSQMNRMYGCSLPPVGRLGSGRHRNWFYQIGLLQMHEQFE